MRIDSPNERRTMTDTYKPIADDRTASAAGSTPSYGEPPASNEAGRTVLAGLLGGVASAVGYIVYTRLPDDQKDRLHAQVRTLVESRVNELRGRFNL